MDRKSNLISPPPGATEIVAAQRVGWAVSRRSALRKADPAAGALVAPAAAAGVARLPGAPLGNWRFPTEMPFLEALSDCETLNCVRDAHRQPRGGAKFNYPHFMIAGWSKSATTSLYQYLNDHPQVLSPVTKEPMLFTDRCDYPGGGAGMRCSPARVKEYLVHTLKRDAFVASRGALVQYEATPRIMDVGPELAPHLAELMPWIRLVASMREPISRAMSKFIMSQDKFGKGCLLEHSMAWCLQWDEEPLFGSPRESYYSHPLRVWLDTFPADQLLIIQYEELVGEENMARELRRVKEFVGVDVDALPDALDWENVNCRHCRIQPEGWPMREAVYRELVARVSLDAEEVARLVERAGLGDAQRWMDVWRKVWDANLATCVDGECLIQLS